MKIQKKITFQTILFVICFFLVFKNFHLTVGESTAYNFGESVGKAFRAILLFFITKNILHHLKLSKI